MPFPRPNSIPYDIPTPNNMGMVRYVLALAVLIEHFNVLAGTDFYFPLSSYNAVGGFFALSGFLIYGSYLKRPQIIHYIGRRALRILPAYFATVIIFAVGLCAISDIGAGAYFGSGQFWKYLAANIGFANFIEPTLPGVFTDAAIPAVNGSLWTMKVEWMLYLSVPAVAWLVARLRRNCATVCIVIYILSAAYRALFLWLFEQTGNEIYSILGRQFLGQMMYFYCGVIIYVYFDSFRCRPAMTFAVAMALMSASCINEYTFILLQPVAISALVLWFSMIGRWGTWEGKSDNVSYNIYLLHYPIIQIAVFFHLPTRIGNLQALVAVILITAIVACLMNICVEKPIQHFFKRPTKQ